MRLKKTLNKTLSNLPESFTIDELTEKLLIIEKVEEGIRQADEEIVVSNEDVRLMIEKWSK